MISCNIKHLESRCRQRGYTLDEVRPCIISQDGDQIVVDETHQAFPRLARASALAGVRERMAAPRGGPGAELKKLLAGWPFFFKITPTCKCNARARHMDSMGVAWCETNIDTVLGYLREAAAERKLPFLEAGARMLVRRAIANAKRKASLHT
jgi:hypothetical protein